MDEQENKQTISSPHRTPSKRKVKRPLDQANQPWRTEQEIDSERQAYLAKRRTLKPDRRQGIYPFVGIPLSRADIEWLLATHENERGPVIWSDESQREREGLDLRGADLRQIDLSNLPLTRMRGGLTIAEWYHPNTEPPVIIHLEGANLSGTHLEGAILSGVHLEDTELHRTYLQQADLSEAHLERTKLIGVHLEQAELYSAYLERAGLSEIHLEGAFLRGAHLKDVNLYGAHLEKADLSEAYLENANLYETHLEGAILIKIHLEYARLMRAYLESANLGNAHLEHTNLYEAHLEHAFLLGAHLQDAFLMRAYLEGANLKDVKLANNEHIGPRIVDVWWSNVSLTVIKWSQVKKLGDEFQAQQKMQDGKVKDKAARLEDYENAVRANRQLAVALQAQGLNEEASRFSYRAEILQRVVLRRQRKFGQYLFSLFLGLTAGYGYRLWQSFLSYLIVIGIFAATYLHFSTHLAWNEAIVISMTAFHGRGFFPDQFHPGDPQALVAAIEAFVGLIIEVTLIATITQRFFKK